MRPTRRPRSAWPRAGTGAARPVSSGRSSSPPTACRAFSTPVSRPVPTPAWIPPTPTASRNGLLLRSPGARMGRQLGSAGRRAHRPLRDSGRHGGAAGLRRRPEYTNPHTDRITLGFEREIFQDTTSTLNFTYAKGYNLERLTDHNRVYRRRRSRPTASPTTARRARTPSTRRSPSTSPTRSPSTTTSRSSPTSGSPTTSAPTSRRPTD